MIGLLLISDGGLLDYFFVLLMIHNKTYKENVLFSDALSTFFIRLYGVGHMVKDHLYSERVNPLPPLHGLLFPSRSKVSFICTAP